jgi:hypothetical protein
VRHDVYVCSGFQHNFAINRERREHRVFRLLLQMVPGMEDRLMEGSEEDTLHIAELVCNYGVSSHMHFSTLAMLTDPEGRFRCKIR